MSASDAVILLLADGFVAVGRVLRGLRRPSGAEVRARAVRDVFLESPRDWFHIEPGRPYERPYDEVARLVEAEAEQEVWEPHDPYLNCCTAHEPAYFDDGPDELWLAEKRSAAVSPPAADNTTTVDHLEAAWNDHTGAVGYAAMRAGGVEWFCEGCNWSGPTKQAHARHRFQVLADMKNATTRIAQQMGGTA